MATNSQTLISELLIIFKHLFNVVVFSLDSASWLGPSDFSPTPASSVEYSLISGSMYSMLQPTGGLFFLPIAGLLPGARGGNSLGVGPEFWGCAR